MSVSRLHRTSWWWCNWYLSGCLWLQWWRWPLAPCVELLARLSIEVPTWAQR